MTPARIALAGLLVLAACDSAPDPGDAPARAASSTRIVTLAPHLAELVFAAGAGSALVGVSAYTDFPAETESLPVVGDAFGLDQEALAVLAPDLILAWQEGTPVGLLAALRERGYRVVDLPAMSIDDIAVSLERIGELTGTAAIASAAALDFRRSVAELGRSAAGQPTLRVFYQVDSRPLFTVGGRHFVSEAIAICGGQNIFADIDAPAAQVDLEAVVARDPQVILAAADEDNDALQHWDKWQDLSAVRDRAIYAVTPSYIARPGLRLRHGVREICMQLDKVRAPRSH